jgi:Immunity protein Imm1
VSEVAEFQVDGAGGMRGYEFDDQASDTSWPQIQSLSEYFKPLLGTTPWKFKTHGLDDVWFWISQKDAEHFEVRTELRLIGVPGYGVYISYWQSGVKTGGLNFYAKGDLARIKDCAANRRGDLFSLALLVPFSAAYSALAEFLETNGALPKCIEWVEPSEVPDAFPPQYLPDFAAAGYRLLPTKDPHR